jgi:hypothetical protein
MRWVIDVNRRELHVFREPERDYSMHRVLTASDNAAVAALGYVGFAVSAIFPG